MMPSISSGYFVVIKSRAWGAICNIFVSSSHDIISRIQRAVMNLVLTYIWISKHKAKTGFVNDCFLIDLGVFLLVFALNYFINTDYPTMCMQPTIYVWKILVQIN